MNRVGHQKFYSSSLICSKLVLVGKQGKIVLVGSPQAMALLRQRPIFRFQITLPYPWQNANELVTYLFLLIGPGSCVVGAHIATVIVSCLSIEYFFSYSPALITLAISALVHFNKKILWYDRLDWNTFSKCLLGMYFVLFAIFVGIGSGGMDSIANEELFRYAK